MAILKENRITKRNDNLPEYILIKQYLLNAISKHLVLPHQKLPSERELAELFSVNRNTSRHALNVLEKEGHIYRSGRKGWFANGIRLVYNPADHVNFAKLAIQQGFVPSWHVFDTKQIVASVATAALFGEEQGIPLYFARETASIDNWLVYYAEILFNSRLCPDILPKIASEPTTNVLEKEYNFKVKQKELLIRPIRLQSKIQNFLNVPPGTPGLYIRRTKCIDDGTIIEIDTEYWRYDAIEMRVN